MKVWIRYTFIIVVSLIMLFPLIFVFGNSLMSGNEIAYYYGSDAEQIVLHIIPDRITLDAFYQVLLREPGYLIKFWNSLGISAIITISQTVSSCLAGFALSKCKLPFQNALNYLIILLMLMPIQVTLVANYLILQRVNLIGNYLAVILPLSVSCFGVFLMKQSFDQIDNSQLEAAKVDGAGTGRIICSIAVPNCKSSVGTIIVLCFVDAWNMVEYPLVLLRDANKYPLSIFLAQATTDNLPLSFASGILALLPPLILFAFFQEELMEGIEMSNLK